MSTWAQNAGKYYKHEKKNRANLSFGDALKELSKLRKTNKLPGYLSSMASTIMPSDKKGRKGRGGTKKRRKN